jgi:hypothetical protein
MSATPQVSTELELRLLVPGASLPVRAAMRYQASDPYAVHVEFRTGEEPVVWTFARQLLTDGVSRMVGEGDVKVWPTRESGAHLVCIALSSPSGRALFEVPLGDVVAFLTCTYELVPTGLESDHLDLDSELALLLWQE